MKSMFTIFAILATLTARAEQAPLTGAEIPDGKAFRLFIGALALGIEDDGPHYVLDVLNLDHDDPQVRQSANRLAIQFVRLNESHEREYRQTEYEVLCRSVPDATDEDRYRALDSLWEARAAVGEKYYRIMLARINSRYSDRVQNYFHRRKNGMTVSPPAPHQPAYEAAGIDPAEKAEEICSALRQGGVE